MRISLAVAVVAAFLSANAASAQDLSPAKPEDLGFSSERLERITKIFREDAAHGIAPGFLLLIARHGKGAHFESVAMLDPQTKAPMTPDPTFPTYSITNPLTPISPTPP